MTYSYTQISQYLTCPRRYRHRYLDGWQEKDTRAAMLFGRAFEQALSAYFLREDAAAVLFREWSRCQDQGLRYSKGDTWDRMLHQGVQLLDRFCQDDRIRIRQPRRNLQIKFTRPVSKNNDFVAYVDAIGKLDGRETVRLVNGLSQSEMGVIVFSGSAPRQESLESAAWGNGAFTKALLDGLTGLADSGRVGFVTHVGLDGYVGQAVRTLTVGRQTPVTVMPQGIAD